jgi:putative ABC transport system permease protein
MLLGSDQKRLIWQFLAESILVAIISLAIALILLGILLPGFNRLTDMSLSLSTVNPWMMGLILVGSAILIGILAGFYPAFLLSSFNTNSVFKDKLRSESKGSTLRSILVIFQFFIAIVILSGTFVVYQQLKFMQNKNLGFDKEGIMVIRPSTALNNQSDVFVAELKKYPGILSITNSSDIPGFSYSDNVFMVEGRSETESFVFNLAVVDYSFVSTYKIKIADGRDFKENLGLDSTVIINETAVRKWNLKILLNPAHEPG